jgi:hypothetical protein
VFLEDIVEGVVPRSVPEVVARIVTLLGDRIMSQCAIRRDIWWEKAWIA